jgi:gas vesicle protein GvpN
MKMLDDPIKKDVEVIKKRFNIVGREIELAMLLRAVESGKHVLLEGPVGVGKTTVASAVATFLNKPIYRVDGDERYTEHKLVGWFDPPLVLAKGYTRDAFILGPLTQSMSNGGILFINELNRMPEGTQNVLLPAMDERIIVIPKIGEVKAKPGFLVIATQNPEEFVGTSRLSEALRDRFVRIGLDYQTEAEEEAIVVKETGYFGAELVKLAVKIIRKTREHPDIKRGSSIRGAIDFVDLLKHHQSKQLSLSNSTYVEAAVMALHNKIETNVRANKSKEEIIKEIVLTSLKETANETKSVDGKKGETLTEGSSGGVVTAISDRKGLQQSREKSIFKHMIRGFITKTHVMSDESRLQTLKMAADSGLWPIIEAYFMLDEDMADADRNRIERFMSRIVMLIASSIGEKGIRKYYRKIGLYAPAVEEFDLDLTLEESLGKKALEYEDIAAIHKHPRKLVVSLMLDISNSMGRPKIITAAMAVAALAYKLEKDFYSVAAFKDKTEVLKSMIEPLSIEELIIEILNLRTGGLTNIKDALEKGAEQLKLIQTREHIGERIGIIITDGWVTAGGDPRDAATLFPKLHVLQVGMGGGMQESENLAKDLARIGRGEYIFVEDFDELPNYLLRIFR